MTSQPPSIPTPPWTGGRQPAPRELADWIRSLPVEDAERVCARILWFGDLESICFTANHDGRIERLEAQLRDLAGGAK